MSDQAIKKDFFKFEVNEKFDIIIQLLGWYREIKVSTIPGATATILTFALLLLTFPKVRIFSVGIWLGLNDSDL